MFIVRIVVPGKKPPSGSVHYPWCTVVWEPIVLRGRKDVTVRGAHVPDDHPNLEQIRELASSLAATEIWADDKVIRCGPPPGAAQPPQAVAQMVATADATVHLRRMAISNGWSEEDLAGTGLAGVPGPAGGRSPRNGLSLVELSLSRPPKDWPALLDASRPPWESIDWAPPSLGWKPPGWQDRPEPDEDAPPPAPAVLPDEDRARRISDAFPGASDIGGDGPPPSPSDAEAPTSSREEETADEDDDGSDPLADYPDQASLPKVRELVLGLHEKRKDKGGEVHPNAINWVLKKLDPPLAPLNSKQIAAIIAEHTTTS